MRLERYFLREIFLFITCSPSIFFFFFFTKINVTQNDVRENPLEGTLNYFGHILSQYKIKNKQINDANGIRSNDYYLCMTKQITHQDVK